ncbi:helix-turn-helix domain-containing protein [Bradyrhizobium guangdongense]|uniref:helix-turn-helix domain-containing protein n=1 Tax=Bradyrhizobium guangdongense TaxID=1325090 RepID=UPI0016434E14|nr:helix-turn-helix domain-containing protein [Bradyrhizobium guangdongense]
MDVRAFNREKMQWLNAISLECEISSTAFRVAYLIADHQNSVAGFAWPSLARLAGKVCLSNKSIQRAVGQLERLGWLAVERRREHSNRYRLIWPPGRAPVPTQTEGNDADKTVLVERQERLTGGDKTVRQSYLTKHPKTFSSRLGGGRQGTPFPDQGKFEAEIIGRFGPRMIDVLEKLNEIDPRAVERLCRRAKDGSLSRTDIAAAELTAAQHQEN